MNLSSPPQKRPYRMDARAEAAAATGERLLTAAWRHFATRSYEDVLLREIATEAGVTAQTLHTRFGSKDELFLAAYAWFGQQEMSDRPAAPTGDVQETIALLFDRYETHGSAILRMLSQEERIPAVRQMTDAGRAYHRHWAETTFAPLLRGLRGDKRKRRLNAIVISTDLLVWKLLRVDMDLRREEAERVVGEMVIG
ncbi:MAG TPA: helix-turn-helix domain-containing protein [Solirubrobacteraceae bacterium]|jgi:AcrR family transcriptional regulator|nr:helix-turn-helix domain-containing protein [Solirubrobacteraceae bacterium]